MKIPTSCFLLLTSFFVAILLSSYFLLLQPSFAWINPSQNPPLGGGVLQTDTSGLKIVTTTQITSGNFTVNSGNVGIGTTAPDGKLHIYGGRLIITGAGGGSNTAQIRFDSGVPNATPWYQFVVESNNAFWIREGINDRFGIFSGGNVYIPGNVGIGTTNPGAKLDINIVTGGAGAYVKGLNVVSTLNATSSRLYGAFIMTDTGNYTTTESLQAQGLEVRAFFSGGTGITQNDLIGTKSIVFFRGSGGTLNNAYSVYVSAPSNYGSVSGTLLNAYSLFVDSPTIGINNNFAVYQNGSAKNYFGGNVGIGTTAPEAKLHVMGNIMLGTQPGYNNQLNTDANYNLIISGVMAQNDYFKIQGTGTSDNGALEIVTGDNGNEPIIFKQISGANQYERMRIDSSGNVGIGTTNPDVKLYVNGITSVGGTTTTTWPVLLLGGECCGPGGSDTGFGHPSDGIITIWTNAAERVRIDYNGNVGIGTTAPQQKLDVNGYIQVSGVCFRPRILVRCFVPGSGHLTWIDNQSECTGAGGTIEGTMYILAQC